LSPDEESFRAEIAEAVHAAWPASHDNAAAAGNVASNVLAAVRWSPPKWLQEHGILGGPN
jgi:hypothetical protein